MAFPYPVSTLIADWSGVFSDDRRPVYEANMRIIEARGRARFGFNEWLATTQIGAREFFASQGLTDDADALFDEYQRTLDALRAGGLVPTPYADALPFLQAVSQRMRIIILSSHPESLLRAEASEYGFDPYVASFVGSLRDKSPGIDNVIGQKEERTAFAYLGDSVFDIQAAKKSGVQSVGISTGYHSRERLAHEQPDVLVDSLTELQGMLIPVTVI